MNKLDLKLKETCKPVAPRRKRVSMAAKVLPIEIPADTFTDDEADNFSIGSPSNRKAKKAVRLEKKRAKIADRSYKKRVKADSLAKRYSGKAEAAIIQAQGESAANQALAQQGIVGNPVQAQPDLAGKALDTVGAYLGGGAPLNDSSIGLTGAEDYPAEYPTQEPKNNMMLYIIIALGAFFLLRKK